MRQSVIPISILLALTLVGCAEPASEAGPQTQSEGFTLGVELDTEGQAKLGVNVMRLDRARYARLTEGPARVLDPRPILAAMAELKRAEAADRASRAALTRAEELFKIDTAVSAEALENARRQSAADAAALDVARAQAWLESGASAPWLDASRRDALLSALTTGGRRVVSASFPSGLKTEDYGAFSVRRLGDVAGVDVHEATDVWLGPADPNVPGQSILALLEPGAELAVGERLVARIGVAAPEEGVTLPTSAIVLAGGTAWCYVRTDEVTFTRVSADLSRPTPEGYFQPAGFDVGQEVVVAGAGLLLAHETGGGEEE